MEFKLIIKKINNTLTREEEQLFQEWYRESESHRAYFHKVRENYDKHPDTIDLKNSWDQLSKRNRPKIRTSGIWKYTAVAAVVLLIISLALFIGEPSNTVIDAPQVTESGPILIGSDKATLTLDNGEQIVLEEGTSYQDPQIKSKDGQIIYTGTTVPENSPIIYNTLTIPRGGEFFISLADGTKVWLNSDSQLKYPVSFAANAPRKVSLLYGEAYFEVSPSSAHEGSHFMVTTGNQEVDVLGTEFNIRAYREDTQIATTLVEGKVLIGNGFSSNSLLPGQQAVLEADTDQFLIRTVDVNNEISWKNGFFSFKEKPLKEILQVLSRWYDVEFVIENQKAADIPFNGVFNKKQHIENILSIIENTNEANFNTVGKTIILK